MKISKPVNNTQIEFNKLCDLGRGPGGGPARTRVQELLHDSGKKLNALAKRDIDESLTEFSDRNPWHVCYAVGICWGHLAHYDLTFVEAAVNLLEDWNDDDLKVARSFHVERGPDPIEQSLAGGNTLFEVVTMPGQLPESLERYRRAQDRWLGRIISKDRPKYIGSWNATAMFMVALFSNPKLADEMIETVVMLPPGGPIYNALKILHGAHFLSRAPAGSALDDGDFESGAIYENNALFLDVLKGHSGWNLLDVHSGLYMLGTRFPASATWF